METAAKKDRLAAQMKNPTTTNHCSCSPYIGESDSATEERKDQGRFCWLVGVSNLHTCGVAGGDNAGDDNDDDDAQKGRREAGLVSSLPCEPGAGFRKAPLLRRCYQSAAGPGEMRNRC